ncbi:MAG: ribonuclease E inhibitor RraB [Thermoleophilia bacterium]
MGLRDAFGRGPKRFWKEEAFQRDSANQVSMAPMTLDQLAELGVSSDDYLKLEYFFYTNAPEKASSLAGDLGALGYQVDHGPSAADKRQIVVTGWTTPMKMSAEVVQAWTRQMCELGFTRDCEFDGWGTTPEQ